MNVLFRKVGLIALLVLLGAGGGTVPALECVGLSLTDPGTAKGDSALSGLLNIHPTVTSDSIPVASARAAIDTNRNSSCATNPIAGTADPSVSLPNGLRDNPAQSVPPTLASRGKENLFSPDSRAAVRTMVVATGAPTPPPDWQQMQTAFLGAPDDPEIPIAVLASMVEEDPWSDTLSLEDENPFAHLIQELTGNDPGEDENPENPDDQEHPDQPADEDPEPEDNPEDGQEEPDDPEIDPGGTDNDEEAPSDELAQVLFIPDTKLANFLRMVGCPSRADTFILNQLDDTHFETENGNTISIEYNYFTIGANYDEFFLADDFTQDDLTDLFCTFKTSPTCSLLVNTYNDFQLAQVFQLPYVPTSLVQLSFFDQGEKQLACYSKQIGAIDFMENIGGLNFHSLLTLPFPSNFDGLASSDFNNDGFDDLILLNFSQNTARYLVNIQGVSLRILSQNIPHFPSPELLVFNPTVDGPRARLWLLNYFGQTLLYVIGPSNSAIPLASYTYPSRGNCLLIGDFNQDEIVDFAIGRVLR